MTLLGRTRATRSLVLSAVLLLVCPAAEARLARNAQERAVAQLAKDHPKQSRLRLSHDPHLHLVARAKARDMARRDYFSHSDPDGYGPNRALSLTGYALPEFYGGGRGDNNIESIVAGTNYNPARAFAAWMKSASHKKHLLAENEFYRNQTRFGVGYARSAGSRFKNYYVFLSAPPSATPLAKMTKTLRNLFLKKTPRQIETLRGGRR